MFMILRKNVFIRNFHFSPALTWKRMKNDKIPKPHLDPIKKFQVPTSSGVVIDPIPVALVPSEAKFYNL